MVIDDPNQMDAGGGRSPRQRALGDPLNANETASSVQYGNVASTEGS